MTEPKPKLVEHLLYEGDNGRITCGKLRCAGMTAHFSGRTIAGQRVRKMTAADNAAWRAEFGESMHCESCKHEFGTSPTSERISS